MKITAINAKIYRIISILNLGLITFMLATPIPTKYPTVGPKDETSCKMPERKDPKNIKNTIKETRIVFLESNTPSNPRFLK